MYKDQRRRRMMDTWTGMKGRCSNPKHASFSRYGARGITVCERWESSFENFLADMGFIPDGCSLDRIDNNGNYEPKNCRWATREQQVASRSTTLLVTIDGITDHLAGWARRRGMTPQTLHDRIHKLGLTVEQALSFPVRKGNRRKDFEAIR